MQDVREGDVTKTYFLGKERTGIVVRLPENGQYVIIFMKDKIGCSIENLGKVIGNAVDNPEFLKMVM